MIKGQVISSVLTVFVSIAQNLDLQHGTKLKSANLVAKFGLWTKVGPKPSRRYSVG